MDEIRRLGGVVRYEFAMQARRLALWIGLGLLSVLVFAAGLNSVIKLDGTQVGTTGIFYTRHDVMVEWTIICQFILVLGAGLLLADRFRRDHSTRVGEVLQTTPAPIWSRLVGKYLGSVLATLMPIALIYIIGATVLVIHWHDAGMVPFALATFAALIVPPVFFVGAYTIACTTVLWSPLYMFLFAGYWVWTSGNPNEAIPTLSGTLLSPDENYVVTGFFHFAAYYPQDAGYYPSSSVALGIAHIAVLLGLAAVALLAAWGEQRWLTSHR